MHTLITRPWERNFATAFLSMTKYGSTLYRDDHGLGSMASLFQFQYEVDVKFDSFM